MLGIPIAIKNLYDTYDMPATNGSLTFAGFRPARDAFQVKAARGCRCPDRQNGIGRIRDKWLLLQRCLGAGVECVQSVPVGDCVQRRFNRCCSTAAGALGSQTGYSLYGPASAASLVTLRGTDGLESRSGIMPLVWMTDFGGAMTRSVSDLTDMLNVVAGTDPEHPRTASASDRIPADFRSVLDIDALWGSASAIFPQPG